MIKVLLLLLFFSWGIYVLKIIMSFNLQWRERKADLTKKEELQLKLKLRKAILKKLFFGLLVVLLIVGVLLVLDSMLFSR